MMRAAAKGPPAMYSDYFAPQPRASNKPAILLLLLGVLALLAAIAYTALANRQTMATAPAAPGNFGAIAMSQSSLNFGSAWGYTDGAAAGQRALKECNARMTQPDCVVRLSLSSGSCGALAVSPSRGQSIVVTDADKTLAAALALAQCQAGGAEDCIIRQNFCGNGA